jgi:hypothetical protein
MALLPSIWCLHKLRQHILDPSCAGPCAVPEAWCNEARGYRSQFQQYVMEGNTERAEDVLLTTWSHFALLPDACILHICPLYDGVGVKDLVCHQIRRIISLEQLQHGRGPGISGSGHYALGGARGVGKTYLLQGLSQTVAVLCRCVLPITLNYEELCGTVKECIAGVETSVRKALVPPSMLLEHYWTVVRADTEASANALLRSSSLAISDDDVPMTAPAMQVTSDDGGCSYYPFLMLDGVNLWYRRDVLRGRGYRIITQLQHFGRRKNVCAVIAGSSACLREQMFAEPGSTWDGWPPLNASLFTFHEVLPIRDVTSLEGYLRTTNLALRPGMTCADIQYSCE